MNIFNANLEVTKATVQGGEIKDLEINRQNVPLASSVKIETSKAVTVDVSTYTEPIEVTSTVGKDAMAKAVVTLTNIPPSADDPSFYAWKSSDLEAAAYYSLSATPAVGEKVRRAGYEDTDIAGSANAYSVTATGTDDDGFYITVDGDNYYRFSDRDFTWGD